MKATLVLLAIVGYLPLISSGAKSIHDWAHELGNKLGPGYSFREVERDGRTCICSTTTQQATPTTVTIPESTAAASTTTVVPTTVPPVETTTTVEPTTVPPSETTTPESVILSPSTAAPSTTTVEPTTVPPVETTTTVEPDNNNPTSSKMKETTTQTIPFPNIPDSTAAPSTTTTIPKATTTQTIAIKIPDSTEAPSTTVVQNQPNGETTSEPATQQQNSNLFGDRSINCDSNVVPVANDRNAATKYSFSTPLYPNEYPEHTCCIWRIVYPEEWMRQRSSRIVTYNYSPDSFLPEECSTDFVRVYDITVDNMLVEREEKCGHIGGQLGIIKHDGDEIGAAFRVCSDDDWTGEAKNRESESTGKVAISFTVVAF